MLLVTQMMKHQYVIQSLLVLKLASCYDTEEAARQWYLYEQIRPFCTTDQAKDITCPLPSVLKPQ